MVRIEDGQFHTAKGLTGHALTQRIHRWARHIIGSDDLDFTIDAIRETRELELWKRNIGGSTYDTIEEFLQAKLHLPSDFHYSKIEQLVEEVSKIKKIKPKTLKELREYRNERIRGAVNYYTQKQVAENFGITERQVKRIVAEGDINLPKVEKMSPSKKRDSRIISLSPDPTKAATQIRKKFGDEFASELKLNL